MKLEKALKIADPCEKCRVLSTELLKPRLPGGKAWQEAVQELHRLQDIVTVVVEHNRLYYIIFK